MNDGDETILGTGSRMALDLKRGVVNTLNNPNPMNWDVVIETAGGSVVTFTVPAGGTFGIKPMDDIARIDLNLGPLVQRGPRSVEMD